VKIQHALILIPLGGEWIIKAQMIFTSDLSSDMHDTMKVTIKAMSIEHYDIVKKIWEESEGIGLSSADNKTSIERFLDRNSGLSFIAAIDDTIAGAILCGEDGRRGYIHHLAVAQKFRQKGIGTALVNRCLIALWERGIWKCHLFVFKTNTALSFWQKAGWRERVDLIMLSRDLV
jgi:ribosomal protein S18 acetylase RimI-like enzyme